MNYQKIKGKQWILIKLLYQLHQLSKIEKWTFKLQFIIYLRKDVLNFILLN